MTRKSELHVGTSGRRPFALPPEVVTQTTAILGIRGSGKTNTGTVIVEELLSRRLPVVVIDPLDVWWGLKSSADGKQEGYPVVVLGGPHGDLPLQEGDGETLADFAVEQHVPLVLSLRHLRKGAQRRFVTDFAERLYHRKGEAEHRTPLLVVADEADSFVPQRTTGDVARMVGAIEDLVRRGRSAGLGMMLISQRAASVNKDVLTQLELLVAHRHTSPQDRKALEEWIRAHDTGGHHDAFMASLASLGIGEAWFWSPGWLDVFERVQVNLRRTFDSSKTPKLGARAAVPDAAAKVDLEALRAKLAVTIEDARANDPKELHRRIAELEGKLRRAAKMAAPDTAAIDAAVAAATRELEAEVAQVRALAATLADRIHRGRDVAAQLSEILRNGDAPTAAFRAESAAERVASKRVAATPSPRPVRTVRTSTPPAPRVTSDLPKGEAAVLTAACQYPEGVDRQQISILTGYKRSSRDTYIQRLREKGLVDTRGTLVVAAAGAERHLPDFEPLPTGRALQEYWLARLPAGEAAVLQALLDDPGGVSRDELSERTGYKRSSRDTYIQRLRARKIVEVEGSVVRAASLLFAADQH